jgi:hypothetical protein
MGLPVKYKNPQQCRELKLLQQNPCFFSAPATLAHKRSKLRQRLHLNKNKWEGFNREKKN